jgi:hypothetical protein
LVVLGLVVGVGVMALLAVWVFVRGLVIVQAVWMAVLGVAGLDIHTMYGQGIEGEKHVQYGASAPE